MGDIYCEIEDSIYKSFLSCDLNSLERAFIFGIYDYLETLQSELNLYFYENLCTDPPPKYCTAILGASAIVDSICRYELRYLLLEMEQKLKEFSLDFNQDALIGFVQDLGYITHCDVQRYEQIKKFCGR